MFFIALLAVALIVGAVVWWIEKPLASASPSNLPASITGQVVQPGVEPNTATAQPVTVRQLVLEPGPLAGKNVVVSGILGHRDLTGYGWNLKYDLFDQNGSSVPLVDVQAGTVTNLKYDVTGWVRVVDGEAVVHVTQMKYADDA